MERESQTYFNLQIQTRCVQMFIPVVCVILFLEWDEVPSDEEDKIMEDESKYVIFVSAIGGSIITNFQRSHKCYHELVLKGIGGCSC